MERLTELKAGQELPVEVIKAWTGYTDISVYPKMREITRVGIDFFEFRNAVDSGNYGKASKLKGFIEFYNKFYNLDIHMKTRMEDWHNTVIYVNGMREGREIQEQFKLLGFDIHYPADTDTMYVRTNSEGRGTNRGSNKTDWHSSLANPTELTYTEAMALFNKSAVTPVKEVRTKIDFRNLSEVYFIIPDMQTQHRLLDKLFELGYLHGGVNSFEPTMLYPIWEVRVDKSIGGRQSVSGPKYTLMDYNLLLNAQLTNTNNTPLNTKTDGNKIIVCKPHPRITNGQRPEGSSVSGKTSRAKVSSGHLSYRTISSCM